ncbi:MAG: hypothetical protein HGB08_01310 [Candidatus Moranbacteria bacterium]|nr:hypothetical protein [Candidatus Moranbacteria bacterium]
MSKVLVINYRGSGDYLGYARMKAAKKSENCFCSLLAGSSQKKEAKKSSGEKGGAKISLLGAGSFMLVFVACTAAFYLFQVNELANKGYEIRDLEKNIQMLEKENKSMQIREVELTSMYSIEKATENLGLVNSTAASYVAMSATVAMK